MLSLENEKDIELMKSYYRASDMIDFWCFFKESSKLERLAIAVDYNDYLKNKDYLDSFDSYRIDSPKSGKIIEGIESKGNDDFSDIELLFKRIKRKNNEGVLLFFDLTGEPTERYKRKAGISIKVSLYDSVCIEAVGRGFDGREISKGICVHERYLIPWFDLPSLTINNFNKYNIFTISNNDYVKTRNNRINYLLSLGLKQEEFSKYIPSTYKKIDNIIWENLIKRVLLNIYKQADLLSDAGYKDFAIGGNTLGDEPYLWQMYNKDRYN